jgi:transposase
MTHPARLHDGLRAQVRAAAGRQAEPTAAVIDSQPVCAAGTVPRTSRGWDNAQKVNGRKRHIAVDTAGLVLAVVITAASVQDRAAARPLLQNLHRTSRRIRLIWADGVYAGKLSTWAPAMKMTLQIEQAQIHGRSSCRTPDPAHRCSSQAMQTSGTPQAEEHKC